MHSSLLDKSVLICNLTSSVPFPPDDAPRVRNPHQLPVLFAKARPNIGLTHEKRRSEIDKE